MDTDVHAFLQNIDGATVKAGRCGSGSTVRVHRHLEPLSQIKGSPRSHGVRAVGLGISC